MSQLLRCWSKRVQICVNRRLKITLEEMFAPYSKYEYGSIHQIGHEHLTTSVDLHRQFVVISYSNAIEYLDLNYFQAKVSQKSTSLTNFMHAVNHRHALATRCIHSAPVRVWWRKFQQFEQTLFFLKHFLSGLAVLIVFIRSHQFQSDVKRRSRCFRLITKINFILSVFFCVYQQNINTITVLAHYCKSWVSQLTASIILFFCFVVCVCFFLTFQLMTLL